MNPAISKLSQTRLVLAEPVDSHPPRDLLHLARAGAGRARLRDGRHERPVDPLAAPDHVLGEEAAGPELGDPHRGRADAGGEPALAVAAPAVALRGAHPVGLGVHDPVDHGLGELADQLLQVDGAVLEARHAHGRHRGL